MSSSPSHPREADQNRALGNNPGLAANCAMGQLGSSNPGPIHCGFWRHSGEHLAAKGWSFSLSTARLIAARLCWIQQLRQGCPPACREQMRGNTAIAPSVKNDRMSLFMEDRKEKPGTLRALGNVYKSSPQTIMELPHVCSLMCGCSL